MMPTKVVVLILRGICKRWALKDSGIKVRKGIVATSACFGILPFAGAWAETNDGDVELGAYLSAECVTCHLASAETDGIPQIVGLDPTTFVDAMLAYKAKQREHPIMQMMAGRLNDEEIAALAAYFGTLK